MNLSNASRTFQLLGRILDVRTSTESFLPVESAKPSLPLRPAQQPLPRSTPESQGISSHHIRRFLQELERNKDLYIQDVMILRNGMVIAEAAYGAQDLRTPKYTFSACKSVTSLAIGLLVDAGAVKLEERVADIFEDLCPTPASRRKLRDMTVEDLLTMGSGIPFTEAEALTEQDWARHFLSESPKFEPGSEFSYTSLNTYMLSLIVRRRSGMGLLDFLHQTLFQPLGITDVHWEKCPMGVEKGGWGLYIRPEDMAKLGQLVMNGGRWQGRQLISEDYIRAATSPHAVPPPTIGDFNYGYQIWVGRQENTFLFNGMLGQNVLGFKDSGIIVLTNAGADTDYQESRYFEIVSRYFGGRFPETLPADGSGLAQLRACIDSLSWYNRAKGTPDERADLFLDHSFQTTDSRAASFGLLPMSLQAIHNNYTPGLQSLAFSRKGDGPELIFREKDAVYRLPIGLGRPEVTELDFHGNIFRVAATGRFTHDEEERPVFYIRLDFMETPCVRILKAVAVQDGILLRATETPGVPYIQKKLSAYAEQPLYKPLILVAAGGTDPDYLNFKAVQLLSPELKLVQTDK